MPFPLPIGQNTVQEEGQPLWLTEVLTRDVRVFRVRNGRGRPARYCCHQKTVMSSVSTISPPEDTKRFVDSA